MGWRAIVKKHRCWVTSPRQRTESCITLGFASGNNSSEVFIQGLNCITGRYIFKFCSLSHVLFILLQGKPHVFSYKHHFNFICLLVLSIAQCLSIIPPFRACVHKNKCHCLKETSIRLTACININTLFISASQDHPASHLRPLPWDSYCHMVSLPISFILNCFGQDLSDLRRVFEAKIFSSPFYLTVRENVITLSVRALAVIFFS